MRRFDVDCDARTAEIEVCMKYHLYRRPNKNTGAFWMDVRIDGVRYREPLGTRDRGEAGELNAQAHRAVEE